MRKVLVAVLGACVLAFCVSAQAVHAETIKVCPPTGDQQTCSPYGSIQEAINNAAPNSVISLTNGVYTEAGIVIDGKDLTIRGEEPRKTIIQASPVPCKPVDKEGNPVDTPPQRVLWASNAAVTVENVTIQNGCLTYGSGTMAGAGIWSLGRLSLYRVIVISNTIVYTGTDKVPMGGGVYNLGLLEIDSSTFLTNTIFTYGDEARGAGVYSHGGIEVVNSTFSKNVVLGCEPTPPVHYDGSAIYSKYDLEGAYNTIAYNQAGVGGEALSSGGAMRLNNSLIHENGIGGTGFFCLNKVPNSEQFSAAGETGNTDLSDVRLSDLLTTTVVPVYRQLDGSSGIDTGVCLYDVAVDQVGDTRNAGNGCDLGAMERGVTYLPKLIVQPQLPDLRVVSINVKPQGPLNSATPAVIEVVIENTGLAPAQRGFWVDLFINPRSTPPNQAGTVWSDLCRSANCTNDLGISWKVTTNLLPTERLTLTSLRMGDPYIWLPGTNWNGTLNAGDVNMWAYVDSWNGRGNTIGWVAEIDETNNQRGPEYRSVAVGQPQYPFSAAQFPAVVSDRPANDE
jgi:hypothetical protein